MANIAKYWERKGFFYYSYIEVTHNGCHGRITKSLDFVSYHLILLIHGEKKLREMALQYDSMGDL